MPRWLNRIVRRVRRLARTDAARFTLKAKDEIAALGPPFDPDACLEILTGLEPRDFSERLWSERSCEWLFVFQVWAHGVPLYIKLALRGQCLVISFHAEDTDHAD